MAKSLPLHRRTHGSPAARHRDDLRKWGKEQHRLDPRKMNQLAEALGLASAQDLHRPPSRQSIDGILQDADDSTYNAVLNLAKSLNRRP